MADPTKPYVDITNQTPEQQREAAIERENRGPQGLYGHFLIEKIPDYKKAGSEKVIQGNNNSFIILGRDRPGDQAEGGGAKGYTHCGMIDLVVGLDGIHNRKTYKPPSSSDPDVQSELDREKQLLQDSKRYFASPNFTEDAARLYLTQFGDIDYYFGIARGTEAAVARTKNASGAAVKADHARIIGRRSVKIVSGKANLQNADMYGEKNAQGGQDTYPGKIDFIAGNYSDPESPSILGLSGGSLPIPIFAPPKLQPLVKGDNLELLLKEMLACIQNVANRVTANSRNLDSVASAFQAHMHSAAGLGVPTSPPVDGYSNWKTFKARISNLANETVNKVLKHDIILMEANYFRLDAYNIKSKFVNTV